MTRTDFETRCRAGARVVPSGIPDTAICRVLGRHLCLVDTNDMAVSPHLMMEGFWEPWISVAIANLIAPGDIVIDVGAFAGYYSLLASDCGARRVYAIEAHPFLSELCRRTISLNGLEEVITLVKGAAWSKSGETLNLSDAQNHSQSANTSQSAITPLSDGYEVRSIALDDLVSETVHVAKIDVEGAEREVWAGMKAIRERCPKLELFVEWDVARSGSHEFLEEILRDGYSLGEVSTQGTRRSIHREDCLEKGLKMLWLRRGGEDRW